MNTRNYPYQPLLEAMGFKIIVSSSKCNRRGHSVGGNNYKIPEGYEQVLRLHHESYSARNDHGFSSSHYSEYLCVPEGTEVDLEQLTHDIFVHCGSSHIYSPFNDKVWADIRSIEIPPIGKYNIPEPRHLVEIRDGVFYYDKGAYYLLNDMGSKFSMKELYEQCFVWEREEKELDALLAKLSKEANDTHDVPSGATLHAKSENNYYVMCSDYLADEYGAGNGNTPQRAIDAYLRNVKLNMDEKAHKIAQLEKEIADKEERINSLPTADEILKGLRAAKMPFGEGMHVVSACTGYSTDTLWGIFKGTRLDPMEFHKRDLERLKYQLNCYKEKKQ